MSQWGKQILAPNQLQSAFPDPDAEKSGFKNHAPFKIKYGLSLCLNILVITKYLDQIEMKYGALREMIFSIKQLGPCEETGSRVEQRTLDHCAFPVVIGPKQKKQLLVKFGIIGCFFLPCQSPYVSPIQPTGLIVWHFLLISAQGEDMLGKAYQIILKAQF